MWITKMKTIPDGRSRDLPSGFVRAAVGSTARFAHAMIQLSIEQLKVVHSKTNPANRPQKAQDNPLENR
jgi:hypothetical protein